MAQYVGLLIVGALLLSGCASRFANETEVTYIVTTPEGVKTEARYKSAKENIGLKAVIDKSGAASFEVEKASTQEAVIAAVLQSNAAIMSMIDKLTAGAKAGALSGS